MQSYIKSLTIKDAIYLTDEAWSQVKPVSIENCWMHALRPAFTSDTPATGDEESDKEADFEGFTPTVLETATEKLESLMEKEQQLCDFWMSGHK